MTARGWRAVCVGWLVIFLPGLVYLLARPGSTALYLIYLVVGVVGFCFVLTRYDAADENERG